MKTLKFDHIDKIYSGGVQAVFDFNLEVEEGEFIVFVGPSGCGKSTVLRMVAGLEEISAGTLEIDGTVVNKLAPKDRNISFVFQDYALYSHLTVYENVGMSLTVRHEDEVEIHDRVMPTSEFLGITEYLNRLPGQLSGGQKQRVAMGRAIARQPKVYLMDEPLSNLDAKLRAEMRTEIMKLQKNLGVTTIYVTHDQVEAMAMASRIVVLKDGRIQQVGAPLDVYNKPDNMFVAGFLGSPQINFIRGDIVGDRFESDGLTFQLSEEQQKMLAGHTRIALGIRPEAIQLAQDGDTLVMELPIVSNEFCGNYSSVHFTMGEQNVVARINGAVPAKQESARLSFDMSKVLFFDLETELAVR
ncbi:MAG: ABC transporter ATP-binding protein [Faecalibacterium sp.]